MANIVQTLLTHNGAIVRSEPEIFTLVFDDDKRTWWLYCNYQRFDYPNSEQTEAVAPVDWAVGMYYLSLKEDHESR